MGSEAEWQTLATDSLKAPTAAEKISLADRWAATSAEPNAPGKEIARKLFEEALTDGSLVGIARAAAIEKAKTLGPSSIKVAAAVAATNRPPSAVATSGTVAPEGSPGSTPDLPVSQGKPLAANRWTELLPLVDLNQDVELGDWLPGPNRSVRCEWLMGARLRLPVILKNSSYDLKVDLRVGSDHDNVNLVIPVGDRHVMLVVDCNEGVSYLSSIKGVVAPKNPAAVRGNFVLPDRQTRFDVSVRLAGDQVKIAFASDGVKRFEYEGPIADLSTPDMGRDGDRFATRTQPYLYSSETAAEFLSVQVRPLDGNAMQVREIAPLAPLAANINGLKRTSLTVLTPLSAEAYNNSFAVNKGTRTPLIGGEECTDYLFAHAGSNVKYSIPAKTRYFTAIAHTTRSPSVQFTVRVDGKEMFTCKGVVISRVVVEIPKDAKVLELECDPLRNPKNDQSCWCFPAFRQ